MNNLWSFLAKHHHWFLFLLLEVISVVLLFSYNSYQGSVWFSSANAVAGKIYEWRSGVTQFFSLSDRNAALELRNASLEQQLQNMRLQMATQDADTADAVKARLEALEPYELIPTTVVANSVHRRDNLITINCGKADGVEPDMGVVCGTGVVGVVYLASEHYAVVIPVLNSRSHISCAIRGKSYFGYLSWNGGNPLLAYLDDVPRHAKVEVGDWVETSGYSAIFPQGISVGKVLSVNNSADGLSYRLNVQMSTDFSSLRNVYVVKGTGLAERLQLQQLARDSLSMTKMAN